MVVQKIAIFGGTGMTGQCVTEYALQKGTKTYLIFIEFIELKNCNDIQNYLSTGLSVRLLYRTEDTVQQFKDRVELVKGDVTNPVDVENTLNGVDGVCVTLGTRNKLEPTTVLSTGLTNIVQAMEKQKIRYISVCLSSFLFWDPDKVPKQFEHLNAEHKRMLDIIKATSLDYIAVMPPHIANEPSSEHKILHDQSPGRIISKYDLAKFFVESLDQPEHYGKVCGIAKI